MGHFAFYKRITGADRLTRAYDSAAQKWQAGIASLGYPAAYQALASTAVARCPPSGPETILDVGTGSGAMAIAMSAALSGNARFDLLDISEEMLAVAKEAVPSTGKVFQGLVGKADLPEHAYDRVLCAHVIEHGADPEHQIQWLHQRLRPGGQLVIAVSRPHWCTAIVRMRWGHAAYRPEAVCAFLEAQGFEDIAVHPHASGPPARTSCGFTARRV